VHEYSFQVEQLLFREWDAEQDDVQGFAFFAGYYPRFPGARVTEKSIGDSAIAGVVYTGLLPRRDKDVTGAGVAWVELFRGGTGQEAVLEWFHKIHFHRRFSLQPDLQYILSPSGIYPDALAFGLRFILTW
jgi:carbohydrate-selective porin OprB